MRLHEFSVPKNQWMLIISNDAKQEVGKDLIDLVQTAYNNTPQGSFVNSIRDVVPSDWDIIDFDSDPDIDSCVFFRGPRSTESWQGYKIQGIGHDGSRPSKDMSIQKVYSLLNKSGWWIESSDAMRAVLKRLNVQSVSDQKLLQILFNDPELTMIDSDTYVRTLPNGNEITETVFGNPVLKMSKAETKL